ncbi:MAG TPA: LptF/LptG family permease [Gemmataceae bacterium]|nr:LptF/LptG family permease [Gemmataceae bacterium]
MFGSILQRMILWELSKVFLMSLVGITGILLLAGIIQEASQQGLGVTQILAAIPLLVPSTLPYTIPATTLFATCVVYGRLAADNEILAIKSAGINLIKVVRPGLFLGVAMSAVTLSLYYRIIPYTHHLLRAMVFNDAQELLYSLLKKHNEIKHSSFPYQIFVRGVRGKTLMDAIFKRKDAHGVIDWVAHAREAELQVLPSKGQVEIQVRHCVVWGENEASGVLRNEPIYVDLPKDFGKQTQRRPRDLTWQEILEKRIEFQKKIEGIQSNIAIATSRLMLIAPPDKNLPRYLQSCNNQINQTQQEIVALNVELQMRPALSLGCLFFILVGCPVGIWFSRSDYLSAFITCFLPIVFVYYPLMLCGTGMAKEGRLNMVPLVWGADAIVGLIGLILFWRLLKN